MFVLLGLASTTQNNIITFAWADHIGLQSENGKLKCHCTIGVAVGPLVRVDSDHLDQIIVNESANCGISFISLAESPSSPLDFRVHDFVVFDDSSQLQPLEVLDLIGKPLFFSGAWGTRCLYSIGSLLPDFTSELLYALSCLPIPSKNSQVFSWHCGLQWN